jgi:hypothetical protein
MDVQLGRAPLVEFEDDELNPNPSNVVREGELELSNQVQQPLEPVSDIASELSNISHLEGSVMDFDAEEDRRADEAAEANDEGDEDEGDEDEGDEDEGDEDDEDDEEEKKFDDQVRAIREDQEDRDPESNRVRASTWKTIAKILNIAKSKRDTRDKAMESVLASKLARDAGLIEGLENAEFAGPMTKSAVEKKMFAIRDAKEA